MTVKKDKSSKPTIPSFTKRAANTYHDQGRHEANVGNRGNNKDDGNRDDGQEVVIGGVNVLLIQQVHLSMHEGTREDGVGSHNSARSTERVIQGIRTGQTRKRKINTEQSGTEFVNHHPNPI